MTLKQIDCICQNHPPVGRDSVLKELYKIRELCPAIKEFFIKDNGLDEYRRNAKLRIKEHGHQSILVLALKKGHLGKVTSPIHRYLMEGDNISQRVTSDYKNAFCENWFRKDDHMGRHKNSKIYLGKLVELLFAQWLEDNGWEIINLEAWDNTSPDILALDSNYEETAFEVKYIGTDDEYYKAFIKQGFSGSHITPGNKAANYALVRLYEAAKQLTDKSSCQHRCAVLIVHWMSTSLCESSFEKDILEPTNLRFYDVKNDQKWDKFFNETILSKYPNIEKDLGEIISGVSPVKIMSMLGWELSEDLCH